MIDISIRTPLEHFPLNINLRLPSKGISVLFGPSGCGKTTILRCIAGLHKANNANIKLDDSIWQNAHRFEKTYRREIGYVFQEPCLFPHLSVKENLCFGLKRQTDLTSKLAITFNEVVELLGLEHLLVRWPKHLSGGEKQRVAIGRALLSQPKVLLMDEPLSALDQAAKADIIPYIAALNTRLAIPIIYVTHSHAEVESLADYIVLLEKGTVIAQGNLQEMMIDLSAPLAHLSEAGALVTAQVRAYDDAYDLSELQIGDKQTLFVPGRVGEINSRQRVKIAANHVSLTRSRANDSTIINMLSVTIKDIVLETAAQCMVRLEITHDLEILARITCRSRDQLQLKSGEQVFAQIKGVSLVKN